MRRARIFQTFPPKNWSWHSSQAADQFFCCDQTGDFGRIQTERQLVGLPIWSSLHGSTSCRSWACNCRLKDGQLAWLGSLSLREDTELDVGLLHHQNDSTPSRSRSHVAGETAGGIFSCASGNCVGLGPRTSHGHLRQISTMPAPACAPMAAVWLRPCPSREPLRNIDLSRRRRLFRRRQHANLFVRRHSCWL